MQKSQLETEHIWFKVQRELDIQFTFYNEPKDTSVRFILSGVGDESLVLYESGQKTRSWLHSSPARAQQQITLRYNKT